MELVVRKNDLLRELQFFQGIVERKNTIPILANVLIEADGNSVRLLATDLEVSLAQPCEASVAKKGVLTLPAKKLFEIVKALPDSEVTIQQDGTNVKVSAERFESRMSTLPREDFPTLPEPKGDDRDDCRARRLREMIDKTQFAITGEDTRYYLNGALLVIKDKQMTMVATDGHRLALVNVTREEAAPSEKRAIIPKKTLTELSRLLGGRRRRRHVRARREPSVLRRRWTAAHLAHQRRAVPRLRARDPQGQRQEGRVRARSPDELPSSASRSSPTIGRAR